MDLELILDQHLDIPVGAILRLEPIFDDDDGSIFAYWIIDDRTGDILKMALAEQLRVV